MKKSLLLIYSILCYLIGLLIILYHIDFFVGLYVPKTVNSGDPIDLWIAIPIDILLLTLFSLQHSIMARKEFKEWFAKKLPPAANRSTYILSSSIILGLVFWLWHPIPGVIFDVRNSVAGTFLWILYGAGWLIGILSTFQIDHFDLFGLKQAWNHMKNRESRAYHFVTPFLYRIVRHPIYLGWILIHWATPYMTAGRFLFATVVTFYIYIAVYFEEKDLIREFGERYRSYRKTTPKIFPVPARIPGNGFPAKKMLIRILGMFLTVILIFSAAAFLTIRNEFRKLESDDPTVWETVIRKLEKDLPEHSEQDSLVLFTGSSSIRFWSSLEKDMEPIPVIKKGFGGSKISDLIYYADRIIIPYHPEKVVVFAGTNDICGNKNDKTPERVAQDFEHLARLLLKSMPGVEIYYISITPTVERWDVWPRINKANQLIKSTCQSMRQVYFIDMSTHFLKSDGKPDEELFWWDGVHLNGKGYAIWERKIRQALLNGTPNLSMGD